MLLYTILRLTEGPTGYEIHQELEHTTNHLFSVGSIYNSLKALERKGFVKCEDRVESTNGRLVSSWTISAEGVLALKQVRTLRHSLELGVTGL